MRHLDWVGLLIGVLGGVMISNLLGASGLSISPTQAAIIIVIIGIIVLILFVYRFLIRRKKVITTVDERMEAITNKSARNGFVATYIILFVILLYTEASNMKFMLDTKLLLTLIAVSLFVFLLSLFFYYYRKA